jgi:hypothetical protein
MKNLYIVKVLGRMYSYEKYVVAKTENEAEEKAKKRFKYSSVRVIEELGEVI